MAIVHDSVFSASFEKFLDNCDRSTGCWLWPGTLRPNGYGQITRQKASRLAHRLSWEYHFGTIPDGLCVLHKCDVKACINPEHLFLGTRVENNLDKLAKGRQWEPKGEAHPKARLTEAQVLEIRELRSLGWTLQSLADKHGVANSTIDAICRRISWRHI